MNFKFDFEKISWQVILILFAGFFFVLNWLTPFYADDITYAFIWDTHEYGGSVSDNIGKLERVNSFTDILISQWTHYFHWGGRTVAHTIVQFFSWIGNSYFDLINVIVFCALVILIFKIGTGLPLRELNKKFLLFILFAIYFFTPHFFVTMIWMDGAINYMWMTTLELLFILPFAIKYRDKNFWNQSPAWCVALMSIGGLLAGWSSESGASVTMFVTFFFIIKFWREGNLKTWMLSGFIFLTIGFLLVVLAPGNEEQARFSGFYPDSAHYSLESFLFRFNTALLPITARESLLFLPIIFFFWQGRRNADATKFILNFLAASIIILLVLMCLPYFPERVAFPATIFLLIASVAALKEILPDLEIIYSRHKKILSSVAKILCIGWFLHLSACTYVYYYMHAQFQARWEIINQNFDAEEIVVPQLKLLDWSEKIIGHRTWSEFEKIFGDISPSFEKNRNRLFAQYYGLKKIRTE